MVINYMYVVLAFAISFLFSAVFTPLLAKICYVQGLYDQPNARKIHKHAIPRLGGILFMPSLSVGVALTLLIIYKDWNKDFELSLSTIVMLVGALLIYLIGFLDDLKGLKAIHKFIIQIIAASFFPLCNLMINNLHGLFGIYEIPQWLSYPLTVFTIILIVNAINLIDGIDGLAASLAFLILSTFAFLYYELSSQLFCLISTSLAGAILAFFLYNYWGKIGKTKIFMGDSGSLFLGYVIAYLAIKYQMSNPTGGFPYREESLLISFSLVFIPCIDVIRVAIQRKLNKKNMFEADKTHIHHYIMQLGLDMHHTLATIITLFIVTCGINYGLYIGGVQTTFIMGIDFLIYFTFIWAVWFFKPSTL